MDILPYANLGATILTFGAFSFLTTSFGVKLGKLSGFKNTTGYKYISDLSPDKVDKLYEEIVKVAKPKVNAPKWAKDKEALKKWCSSNQKSLRKWSDTSKYCLIQNTVRHKLIELEENFTIKNLEQAKTQEVQSETAPAETAAPATGSQEEKCTEDLLNSYTYDKNSLYYMLGKKYCNAKPAQPSPPAAATDTAA